jgi:hypothetical protein
MGIEVDGIVYERGETCERWEAVRDGVWFYDVEGPLRRVSEQGVLQALIVGEWGPTSWAFSSANLPCRAILKVKPKRLDDSEEGAWVRRWMRETGRAVRYTFNDGSFNDYRWNGDRQTFEVDGLSCEAMRSAGTKVTPADGRGW